MKGAGMDQTAESGKRLAVLPAYNEEKNLPALYRELREKAPEYDVLAVNDGSTDGTLACCRENGIPALDLAVNLGIGGAVQAGYRYAAEHGYGIAVQVDGDGQHDPAFLESMYEKLLSEDADMVIGSRFLEREGYQSTALRRQGIRYLSRLIRLLTGKTVTDPTSGFRMVRRPVIEAFAEDYPQDYPEPESLVRLLRQGKKVVEVPVRMRERSGGASSIGKSASMGYLIKVTAAILLERMRNG
jgi:hypothetical protein